MITLLDPISCLSVIKKYWACAAHGLLILFLRLGPETRIPPVPKDCFGIVQVGNDIFKKFYRANFDFL